MIFKSKGTAINARRLACENIATINNKLRINDTPYISGLNTGVLRRFPDK
jgi:hypothetical protein